MKIETREKIKASQIARLKALGRYSGKWEYREVICACGTVIEKSRGKKFCSPECRPKKSIKEINNQNVLRVTKRRKKVKELAVEYKGGHCELCGYCKSVAALEFHHKDPSEKDFSISNKGHTRSWEKTKDELDKCILLCSNCHRETHERLRLEQ